MRELEVVDICMKVVILRNILLHLTLAMKHKAYGLQQDGSWYREVPCGPKANYLSNQLMEYCKPLKKESLIMMCAVRMSI